MKFHKNYFPLRYFYRMCNHWPIRFNKRGLLSCFITIKHVSSHTFFAKIAGLQQKTTKEYFVMNLFIIFALSNKIFYGLLIMSNILDNRKLTGQDWFLHKENQINIFGENTCLEFNYKKWTIKCIPMISLETIKC